MNEPFTAIGHYYDALVREHGHAPRACDYGRAESQRVKFDVLSDSAPLNGRHLLDVGCGFADFADYLRERNPPASYTGWDLCAGMVEQARRLHPELSIRQANVLTAKPERQFDVVMANGIFYLLGDEAWPLMQAIVRRMYALAGEAVVFNSLSSWATDQEPREFHADPAAVLDFCRTLTPLVALRHDYHPRDFTVVLRKTPEPHR